MKLYYEPSKAFALLQEIADNPSNKPWDKLYRELCGVMEENYELSLAYAFSAGMVAEWAKTEKQRKENVSTEDLFKIWRKKEKKGVNNECR